MSHPNVLASALASRREAGRTHLDLTISNPTRAAVAYDAPRIVREMCTAEALVYEPEPFGLASARNAVAALATKNGVYVEADRVVLTASTSEAYAFLFKLLCDPGDAVLVPEPSYPLFEHLARYEGVRATTYPLRYDGAWHLDVAELRARVGSNTRAVVVVSPNNPTGSFLKRDELGALAELGLPIVSDEVFAPYAFGEDARRVATALEARDTLVFALDGLSKRAALPQLKLSWITVGGPPALAGVALDGLAHLADTYLSPGGPVQHALPALLALGEEPQAAIRERTFANHATLVARSRGTSITPFHVEGGWYAAARLPAVKTEEEWVLGLLDACDVLVQPGWFYDFADEPVVVLSLLTPGADFDAGLERMAEYVEGG